MVWYSHLLKNFPQFIVIHTVKGFGIVNKEEIDVFLELSCFFHDPADVGNLISGSSAFSFFYSKYSFFFFSFLILFNFLTLEYCIGFAIYQNESATSIHVAFSKTSLNIWKFTVHVLLKPGLENFQHYFTSV